VSYSPAQQQVIELLGRPPQPIAFDPGLRAELVAFLEAELEPLAGLIGDDEVWMSTHTLASVHGCETHFVATQGDFAWTVANARGTVAHKAIELSLFWRGEPEPMELATNALARLAEDDAGAGRFLQGLGEADRAQLLGEVNALVATFLECFPPLKPKWTPVCESKSRVELLGGRVVLSGKVDLTLGRSRGYEAEKVIVDLKSGQAAVVHRDDLRFYALVETLKLGVPPRLLASYYLETARAQPEDVSVDLLFAAARRTADGVRKVVELRSDSREPAVRPGPSCRWCPLRTTCPEGIAHLEGDA
jgi:CRISPR/Cas system-associated exonuclease Cas4 (RecB family)